MKSVSRTWVGARALAFLLPCFLLACGGGGGSSSAPAATVDLLVTDAPVDDLLSFSSNVTSMRLKIQGGGTSANLLDGSVSVEFLGLASLQRWLGSSSIAPGTYSGIELEFEPASYVARDLNGTLVPVTATSDSLSLDFLAPFVVDDSGYRRVVVDLDLVASLGGTVPAGVSFDPQGSASDDDGSLEAPIDELRGRVVSFDSVAFDVVVDAFADHDQLVPLGRIHVGVPDTAVLVDDNGSTFANRAAFFAALSAGTTFLEVNGNLVDGQVQATTIQVDDAGGGGNALVRIEGRILSLVGGTTMELAIRDIEQGVSIAESVLDGLGNPASIDVAFDSGTPIFLSEHEATNSGSLAVGQVVKVRFNTFATEPFPASEIEIELGDGFAAFQVDVDANTAALEGLSVRMSEASAQAALAAQGGTVSLLPTTSAIARLGELRDGDPLIVRGRLVSSGAKLELRATRVERAHSTLRGSFAGGSIADASFVLDIEPAAGIGARYQRVAFDGQTRWTGALSSARELFAPRIGPAPRLVVDVEAVRGTDVLRARGVNVDAN